MTVFTNRWFRVRVAMSVVAVLVLCAAPGCGDDKPNKAYKTKHTRRIKREKPDEKPPSEAENPIDTAWNEPPTTSMCRLRFAVSGAGRPIKGRPSFMAPQFELVAVEQLERMHEEGFRPTDRKKSIKFNPNEAGRFVWDLPPGHWKITLNPLDELWMPWISEPLTLEKDTALSVDVKLVPPAALKPKYE